MTFDERFPCTYRGKIERIPWLSHAGGLGLWKLEVKYERNPFELRLYAKIIVPSVKDGQLSEFTQGMFWRTERFIESPEYAMVIIMKWIHDFCMCEVKVGLIVDGTSFYKDELDKLHE